MTTWCWLHAAKSKHSCSAASGLKVCLSKSRPSGIRSASTMTSPLWFAGAETVVNILLTVAFLDSGNGTERLGPVDHEFLVISHDSHEFVFVDGLTDQVMNLELAAAFQ